MKDEFVVQIDLYPSNSDFSIIFFSKPTWFIHRMKKESTMFKECGAEGRNVIPSVVLQRGVFQVDDDYVHLMMTEESFLIYANEHSTTPSHECVFTFELKCEVIYMRPERVPFGPVLGFTLQNEGQKLDFRCSNQVLMQQWATLLERLINQRGFHRLFSAKRKIGRGAFATVYLVERLRDGGMFAAKAFSKLKQFATAKGKQSIENQIKLMRKVNHPNLVHFESIYETENSIYIILEYLKGTQLNALFTKELEQGSAKKILSNILLGLVHLEQKGIVHRDIKPDNIIMRDNEDFGLAICDFGLAIQSEDEEYLYIRCGTPGFVSPEIINIKDTTTKTKPISDVFSAGVIFHYLLFGRSIFKSTKCTEILSENRRCAFQFTDQCYTKLNPHALELLQGMLETDPRARLSAKDALLTPYFLSISSNPTFIEPIVAEPILAEIQNKTEASTMRTKQKTNKTPRLLISC